MTQPTAPADLGTTYWKRHDTGPPAVYQVQDPTGAPVNLTGCSVKFIMTIVGGSTPKINAAAVVSDAVNGIVKYAPTGTGDTSVSGSYLCEWEVTFGDATKETFPGYGYLPLIITDDLDNA